MPQVSEFSLPIGELQLPLDITSVIHAQAGQLGSAAHPDFNFRFRYRDIAFTVHCANAGGQADARMTATLGVLPFSAESAVRRQLLAAISKGAVEHLGPILFLSRGQIQLDARIPLTAPITAAQLVAGIAGFLLPLKPYIELIAMVRML